MTVFSKVVGVGLSRLLLAGMVGSAAFAACTGSGNESAGGGGAKTGGLGGSFGTGGGLAFGGSNGGGTNGSGGDGQAQVFDVLPAEGAAELTIVYDPSKPPPTVNFQAVANGAPVSVGWSIDRGEIGTVTPRLGATTVFTARGTGAGAAIVTAGLNGRTVQRHVTVKIAASQNGASASDAAHDVDKGGGVGGVGGEGVGVALDATKDAATLMALAAPTDPATQGLRLLYPYDATVFPRGVLPPLLQWSSTLGDADGISITLSTKDGSFSYTGTFGRPAGLAAGQAFVRHPIPIDAWNAATNTAGADNTLTLSLVVAKGGAAYGPIKQTYTIAPSRLTGTVYYNSYGTNLVSNWGGNNSHIDASGKVIGAAILSIRSGDTGPTLRVGENSASRDASGNVVGDISGCRVCHVVSAGGSRLIVQGDGQSQVMFKGRLVNNGRSFAYDLKAGTKQEIAPQFDGVLGWVGLNHDGAVGLTNTIDPSGSNPTMAQDTSRVYTLGADLSDPTQLVDVTAQAQGLPQGFAAGYPAFSPDDKHVAFDYAGGAAVNDLTAVDPHNGEDRFKQLAVVDFDKTTLTFSNLRRLATPATGKRVGFPSFLPGGDAVVYQVETKGDDAVMVTRKGARGELWWATLTAPAPVALNKANGKNADGSLYIPAAGNNHGVASADGGDDSTLNYEPTVLPVAAGGFAWVVFTSRRLYGNVGINEPWDSDPKNYGLKQYAADHTKIPTKKLWVAAIDLNAPAGTDPSHPAFYLPAQEIVAGNSRGFWVLDPCHEDGASCETGDQCCGGFCQPNSTDGALICSNMTNTSSCSKEQEKCTVDADCCGAAAGVSCLGGFCSRLTTTPH